MKTFQVTLLAAALSIGHAWAADDVGLPATPMEMVNQDQLLTILEVMNTVEIEQAEFALQHAIHADLKALAQRLLDDHTRSNLRIDELKRADFEPQPSDISDQIAVQSGERSDALTNLEASKFDCVYLSDQSDLHQLASELVSRHVESPDAMSQPVKDFLDRTLVDIDSHSQSLQVLLEQSICQEIPAEATR